MCIRDRPKGAVELTSSRGLRPLPDQSQTKGQVFSIPMGLQRAQGPPPKGFWGALARTLDRAQSILAEPCTEALEALR
eukprot:4779040-Pyramimonas_sp.AAC.1